MLYHIHGNDQNDLMLCGIRVCLSKKKKKKTTGEALGRDWEITEQTKKASVMCFVRENVFLVVNLSRSNARRSIDL